MNSSKSEIENNEKEYLEKRIKTIKRSIMFWEENYDRTRAMSSHDFELMGIDPEFEMGHIDDLLKINSKIIEEGNTLLRDLRKQYNRLDRNIKNVETKRTKRIKRKI